MEYKKDYFRWGIRCIVPAVLTVAANVLCLCLRTEENHSLMQWLNILTDWLCGVFLVYAVSCELMPRRMLYRLSCRRKEEIQGRVEAVQTQPIRYEKLNCVTMHIGNRKLFAPVGMQLPQAGESAVFSVAGNVILEVRQ